MNALAVLERSHKGPLYFRLKVKGDEEGRLRERTKQKMWKDVIDRREGMLRRKKDVVVKKRRKTTFQEGMFLHFNRRRASASLTHVCWCHFPCTHTLLCCTIFTISQCSFASVVCLPSVQWQDFWDKFTLCNAQTAVLLPFYLVELTCRHPVTLSRVILKFLISVNW